MQYRLLTLFLAVAMVWTSMAVFGPWGLAVSAIIMVAVVYIRSDPTIRGAAARTAAVLAIVLTVALVYPAHTSSRVRHNCLVNIENLGRTLLAYHETHGRLPPAYVSDADGKRLHSWRVLILPYSQWDTPDPRTKTPSLFDQYDLAEPWDGPSNRKLIAERPYRFSCRADPGGSKSGTTSFLAVIGPGTVWEEGKTVTLDDIRDPSSTILLVEAANSGIDWTQPEDLSLEQALAGVNQGATPGIGSGHPRVEDRRMYWIEELRGASVVFADGETGVLAEDCSPEMLKMLLDRNHEPIADRTEFDAIARARQARDWQATVEPFAWAALLLSVAVLLFRPRRIPYDTEIPSQDS